VHRDGILVVDKPAGLTSAAVVRDVKRRLGGAKVGHLGTLDPFATGVLPLAIGEGAKLVPFLNQDEKAYIGRVALGRATNTLDSTGQTTEERPVPALTAEAIEAVAARFRGEIDQVPPMFSALKRGGQRLYDLARRGIELELPPRRVHIRSLEIRAVSPETLDVSMRCSKGTYVRSLARDVAAALGTVGHLSVLRRTEFGRFRIEQSIPLDAIAETTDLPVIGLRAALDGVREIEADDSMAQRIRRGQQYALDDLPPPACEGEVAKVIGVRGELVAMIEASAAGWRIARVLAADGGVRDPTSP
jgi:tRNA pseudouridine55 synthase